MDDLTQHLRFFADLGVTHLNLTDQPGVDNCLHPPAPAGTLNRSSELTLDSIRAEMGDCRRCKLCSSRTNIVYGTGAARADLMFVGEAPGFDEDREGEPFVGKAGQLLTRIIETMFDIPREQVYIANILKCRPPKNRDPEPDEVAACSGFLEAQIEAVNPKIIIALGRYAAQTLLEDMTPIGRLRGHFRSYKGRPLMPTFHPSYLLRSPAKKKEVWLDMKAVRARLESLGSSYYR